MKQLVSLELALFGQEVVAKGGKEAVVDTKDYEENRYEHWWPERMLDEVHCHTHTHTDAHARTGTRTHTHAHTHQEWQVFDVVHAQAR